MLSLAATVGCGPAGPSANTTAIPAAAERTTGTYVLCARDGQPLEPTCSVEQTQGRDGLVLTMRHADGGFRRLLVTRDGRGVVAADGADVAKVSTVGPDLVDVVLGNDRYRLPATIRPAGRPS